METNAEVREEAPVESGAIYIYRLDGCAGFAGACHCCGWHPRVATNKDAVNRKPARICRDDRGLAAGGYVGENAGSEYAEEKHPLFKHESRWSPIYGRFMGICAHRRRGATVRDRAI